MTVTTLSNIHWLSNAKVGDKIVMCRYVSLHPILPYIIVQQLVHVCISVCLYISVSLYIVCLSRKNFKLYYSGMFFSEKKNADDINIFLINMYQKALVFCPG